LNVATVRRQLDYIASAKPHPVLSRWDVLLKCLASVEALPEGTERVALRSELQAHLVFQSDVDMAEVEEDAWHDVDDDDDEEDE